MNRCKLSFHYDPGNWILFILKLFSFHGELQKCNCWCNWDVDVSSCFVFNKRQRQIIILKRKKAFLVRVPVWGAKGWEGLSVLPGSTPSWMQAGCHYGCRQVVKGCLILHEYTVSCMNVIGIASKSEMIEMIGTTYVSQEFHINPEKRFIHPQTRCRVTVAGAYLCFPVVMKW